MIENIKYFILKLWEKKKVVLGAALGSFSTIKVMLYFDVKVESWGYWVGITISTLFALWPLIVSACDSLKERNITKKINILFVGSVVTCLIAWQLLKEFALYAH